MNAKSHNGHHNIGSRKNKSNQSKIVITQKVSKEKQYINGANCKAQIGNHSVLNGLGNYYSHDIKLASFLVSSLLLYFCNPIA